MNKGHNKKIKSFPKTQVLKNELKHVARSQVLSPKVVSGTGISACVLHETTARELWTSD